VSDVSLQPPSPLPPPPGWYADPGGSGGQRWWDGTRWTEHVHRAVGAPPAAPAAPTAANPVKPRYRQKWWHLPLVIGLAVVWTVVWIALQFLT
jgi:hypothetical protein